MNPLLDFSGLPRFDAVMPEHVAPAIRQLIDENRGLIDRLVAAQTPATWDDFVQPMLDAGERLSRAWGIVGHLHAVMDVPDWREAYNANLPEVTRFFAELGQNQAFFASSRQSRPSPRIAPLAAQQRIVEHEIRDFRLSGAELPEADKPRFQAIQEELPRCRRKFSENLLDATNAFAEFVGDEAELAGMPADAKAARAAAQKDGDVAKRAGWKFTLHMPSYLPVMQYAESRGLREALYRAYATRAAEFHDLGGKPEWDNMPLIRRLLELRAEEAGHLGYGNFAEVSLVPKMAESPADVLAFLRELAVKAKPFAERDMAELREFARAQGLTLLEPWDIGWASEKLKQARYSFSDEEVKQYFPRAQGAGPACSASSRRCLPCASGPTRRRSGTRMCASSASSAGGRLSGSSTSTSTPATPSAAAPGWTTPSPAATPGGHPDAGGLPQLQFLRPRRRQQAALFTTTM
jgi:oligopeptidase A